jgi:hypothetical protein
MAKALVGVHYGKLTSEPKPRRHTRGRAKMTGRSGPPMVDVGSKKERRGTAKTVRDTSFRFAKTGSVSERNSHSGPSDHPTIGGQKNRSGSVGPYK